MASRPVSPKRRKIQLEYVQPDFSDLNAAIDAMIDSESQEDACVALTKATVGINGYLGPTHPVLRSLGMASPVHPTMSMLGYDPAVLGSFHADVASSLDRRLQRYFAAVKTFVDKYGPQEYQVSAGFPAGVSVSFTWTVGKQAGS